jgi:hypothetical protein
MPPAGGVMHPENLRHTRTPHDRRKDRLWPRHVANGGIVVTLVKQLPQPPPGAADRQRMAYANLAQQMNPHCRLAQFMGDAIVEAQREFGFHLGAQFTMTRQRHQ